MISALNKYTKVSYQTPVWNTQSSNQQQQINIKPTQKQRNSQMSILDKIRASKNIDLEDIDISHKITKTSLINCGYQNNLIKDSRIFEKQNIGKQTKSNISNFTPINLNKTNQQQKSSTLAKNQKQKQNVIYTPARSKIINPTQSRTEKVTPQKSSRKLPNQSSRISRPPLTQLSVHQQLYLDSRKKQIKKSTQLMIQNQYFKKKHPFKPQIGEISQFLAQERFEKIKERQQFEKQFQQFDDWRRDRKLSQSAAKSANKIGKDIYDLKNLKQSQQKQNQLKNYTMLRQFFYYLTDSEETLYFVHLSSKKLCQLPSPMIKFLEPIIETFYKNKNKYKLTWLQFLSEFNLKVNKRKAFYSLIEKWFNVKFGVIFEGAAMQQRIVDNEIKVTKGQDSTTYLGNSLCYDENSNQRQSQKRR